jgi:hypothetical protein
MGLLALGVGVGLGLGAYRNVAPVPHQAMTPVLVVLAIAVMAAWWGGRRFSQSQLQMQMQQQAQRQDQKQGQQQAVVVNVHTNKESPGGVPALAGSRGTLLPVVSRLFGELSVSQLNPPLHSGDGSCESRVLPCAAAGPVSLNEGDEVAVFDPSGAVKFDHDSASVVAEADNDRRVCGN